MMEPVNYIKVGRADDIEKAGWVKVSRMGWDILIFSRDSEFVALELGKNWAGKANSLSATEYNFSQSGLPVTIDKFLSGPRGSHWGQLQYFPVIVENEFVFVGLTR